MRRIFLVMTLTTVLSCCAVVGLMSQDVNSIPSMHSDAVILPFRKTFVDRVQYGAYVEANKYVNNVDVIFMGDSVTDLWFGAHPDFFTKNGFIGRGIGGQTSICILARFRQDVVNLHPKMVVILAGINDIAHNDGTIDCENVVQNLASMCDLAKANNITPLLCSLTPCNRFYWAPEEKPSGDVQKLNLMIKEYAAAAGVEFVDYYGQMSDKEGGMKEGYSDDGCHPTTKGYNVMERIIVKHIGKISGNKTYYVTPE